MQLKSDVTVYPSTGPLYEKLLSIPKRQRAEFIRSHANLAVIFLANEMPQKDSTAAAPVPFHKEPDAEEGEGSGLSAYS
jgi:hypothetical protein